MYYQVIPIIIDTHAHLSRARYRKEDSSDGSREQLEYWSFGVEKNLFDSELVLYLVTVKTTFFIREGITLVQVFLLRNKVFDS